MYLSFLISLERNIFQSLFKVVLNYLKSSWSSRSRIELHENDKRIVLHRSTDKSNNDAPLFNNDKIGE